MCTPRDAAEKSGAIVTTRAGSPAIAIRSGSAPPAQSNTASTFGAIARTRSTRPVPYVVGSAPSDRRKSWLRSPAVPITVAPRATAICTATVPTAPAAPWTSTVCPAPAPSRSRTRVDVSTEPAAPPASSQLHTSGFGAQKTRTAWSALAPRAVVAVTPNTSSPIATPVTPSPTSSTTPAASNPVRHGNAVGTTSRIRPERIWTSPGAIPDALTAMRTSPGPACGASTSATRITPGGPYSEN
ncbi:hypothetical protein LUX39_41370 [Actinomadura madurae]|nr:hypothetical protein [Actinomadura madurae]MCQ0019435.1 hypothetical protein [Actinomadura madurae]